jgi:hypothetical protein
MEGSSDGVCHVGLLGLDTFCHVGLGWTCGGYAGWGGETRRSKHAYMNCFCCWCVCCDK